METLNRQRSVASRHTGTLLIMLLAGSAALACRASAQICAGSAARLSVQILDVDGAAVTGARVTLDGKPAGASDARGLFQSGCVDAGMHTISVVAEGFAMATLRVQPGSRTPSLQLKPLTVETSVEAAQEDTVSTESVAGTKTLEAKEVAQLADDPDEFERQLQVLAAAAGGAPGQAIIAVDGFQNGGKIPPKSAIAFIRVNPDLFSAEYERPPYQGGRVEIYTKPGQSRLHGALFTTQSGQFLNAKDPFAPTRAAIGKQRYGFELGGPVRKNRSDWFTALEHRQIAQFAVVNAVTLDASGNAVQTVANVATPQSLWEGSARLGLLLSPKNNFTRHLHREREWPDQRGCGRRDATGGRLRFAAGRARASPHESANGLRQRRA